MTRTGQFDVAIIGAGPAGLEAALVLGRQQRSVVMLDSGEYRNKNSSAAHMMLGQEGIAPAILRSRTLENLEQLPGVEYIRGTVTEALVSEHSGQVVLQTSGQRSIQARRLILASGQQDLCKSIPGLEQAFGRYAFHCPYCHGFEASNKEILVLAIPGAPIERAAYQALYIHDRISPSVRLLAPTSAIPKELSNLLRAASIDIIDGEVRSISGSLDDVSVMTTAETQIQCEAIFAAPPTTLGSGQLITSLGLTTQNGYVLVDQEGRTSCKQVFAAGDIAVSAQEQEPLTFVSQAVAEGQKVAVWADQDLFMESLAKETT